MSSKITVSDTLKHKLSRYLYMQFAEPLSNADSSIDAAWDYLRNRWQPKTVDILKKLAPPMIRWGGCFASHYHWYEAVGPREKRVPIHNLCWDGLFSNQVGTCELYELAKILGTELLMTVNFESEGSDFWAYPAPGMDRKGTASEAADWIRYCNDPDNQLRKSHGYAEPFNIKYWQIGNETGYLPELFHNFNHRENARKAVEFVKAMREADPSVRLTVWGDGPNEEWQERYNNGELNYWTQSVCEAVGDSAELVAFHNHFGVGEKYKHLEYNNYRKDFDLTYSLLLDGVKDFEDRIDYMRRSLKGFPQKIAITEGHFAMAGRHCGRLFSSWCMGLAYAKCCNILERNGDLVEIATLADFMGNCWQNNAVILPNSCWLAEKMPYFQPVGSIMGLFSSHMGEYAVEATAPDKIDVSASCSGDKLFLHLVNLDSQNVCKMELPAGENQKIKVWEIASDLDSEVDEGNPEIFAPREFELESNIYTMPTAGVAAIEIQ
ncbi:MAG: hypothetical protein IKD10_13015 [Lentisphaeria bacterium]|nr:hypothetical protein [Lentisphaeria bacterium]